MKKRLLPALCVLLLVSAAFAILRRQEVARNADNLNRLWLAAAAAGETVITEYRQNGEEPPPCQVISELRVMGDVRRLSKDAGPDYTDLNAVYGILSLYPEWCFNVTEKLLLVFQTASQEGLDGPNWPLRVNELRNILEYGR